MHIVVEVCFENSKCIYANLEFNSKYMHRVMYILLMDWRGLRLFNGRLLLTRIKGSS